MAGPTTVVIEQPVVTVVTVGMQGPTGPTGPTGPQGPAGVGSIWAIHKNSIGTTETATVPAGSFIIGVSAFDIQGTLDNAGTMVVL